MNPSAFFQVLTLIALLVNVFIALKNRNTHAVIGFLLAMSGWGLVLFYNLTYNT